MPLSGRQWTSKFPDTTGVAYLFDPAADLIADALSTARDFLPYVKKSAPPERTWLMHYAYRIAREGLSPSSVPALKGLDIQWLHLDPQGRPDLAASRNAAEHMVQGYGLFQKPALPSSGAPSGSPPPISGAGDPVSAPQAAPAPGQANSAPGASPSGRDWVSAFSQKTTLDTLVDPFRENARRFITALQAARAAVNIADTFRPPERAYLMHYSFRVARNGLDPAAVPAMRGVNIQWLHTDGQGRPDMAASRTGAEQMVQGFHIVYQPALKSRHTQGLAIDMSITWQNDLEIADGNGRIVDIASTPRTGAGNTDLHAVGATYGLIKLVKDAPHWSSDGH